MITKVTMNKHGEIVGKIKLGTCNEDGEIVCKFARGLITKKLTDILKHTYEYVDDNEEKQNKK